VQVYRSVRKKLRGKNAEPATWSFFRMKNGSSLSFYSREPCPPNSTIVFYKHIATTPSLYTIWPHGKLQTFARFLFPRMKHLKPTEFTTDKLYLSPVL